MPKENFPYEAIAVLGRVLEKNSGKYEPGHWRTVPIINHCNHAIQHLDKYAYDLSLDINQEDHLAHAFVRLAMAVAVREARSKKPDKNWGNHATDALHYLGFKFGDWRDNWATYHCNCHNRWHDDWF